MTIDLFLFMGQSNMAGRGITSARCPEETPKLIPHAGYEYRAVSDPTALHPITETFGRFENRIGGIDDSDMKTGSLVTAFVNAYYQETFVPIVGVSASKGGTSILQWQPRTPFLEDVKRRLADARDYLRSHDFAIRHTAMVWCQGETDGDHGMSGSDYRTNFLCMWNALKDLGIEHCYLISIGQYNGLEDIDYQKIHNAQLRLCEENTDITLASDDFWNMKDRGLMKDAFHYYQKAYNEVGSAAGRRVGVIIGTRLPLSTSRKGTHSST